MSLWPIPAVVDVDLEKVEKWKSDHAATLAAYGS